MLLYDWNKLLNDHRKNECVPFKVSMYPLFDYSHLHQCEYNYLNQLITCGIIPTDDALTIIEEQDEPYNFNKNQSENF